MIENNPVLLVSYVPFERRDYGPKPRPVARWLVRSCHCTCACTKTACCRCHARPLQLWTTLWATCLWRRASRVNSGAASDCL